MKIFVTDDILDDGPALLRAAGHEVEVWQGPYPIPRANLLQKCTDADALLCTLAENIDAEFISQNHHLKVISNYAVGYNNIDVAAASKWNIPIGNTPDVLTEATAELTMSLILATLRNIVSSHHDVTKGRWQRWDPKGYLGTGLGDKTVGIFGMGRIGREVSRLCHAFGAEIIYCSRSEVDLDFPVKKVTFEEVLRESDVMSVHCPLNGETEGLFNADVFQKMKRGAYFFNTSRGPIHNEKDLLKFLENGHLSGAGLDVTNPEPISANSPLLKLPNVVVTPHIGSATFKARGAMSRIAGENILAALEGRPLPGFVNPEINQ